MPINHATRHISSSPTRTVIGFSLLVILFYASGRLASYGVHTGVETVNQSNFYLFVGIAVFSFEGAISLTIPLVKSVDPRSQVRC